jgi:uncharacterized coiled-coil protein SlyX
MIMSEGERRLRNLENQISHARTELEYWQQQLVRLLERMEHEQKQAEA